MSVCLKYRVEKHAQMSRLLAYLLHDEELYALPPGECTLDPTSHPLLGVPLVACQAVTSPAQAGEEMRAVSERRVTTRSRQASAFHLVQSFSPAEVRSAWVAHELGRELMHELFPQYQAVMATHVGTAFLHNHFIVNADSFLRAQPALGTYLTNCGEHWMPSFLRLQVKSDELLARRGISAHVVENPQETPWQARHWPTSRTIEGVNMEIRAACQMASNMDEFERAMRGFGYAFSRDHAGQVRLHVDGRRRSASLHGMYTREELEEMMRPDGRRVLEAEDERWADTRLKMVAMIPFPEQHTSLEAAWAAYLCLLARGRRHEQEGLRLYSYSEFTRAISSVDLLLRRGIRTEEQLLGARDAELLARREARSARRLLEATIAGEKEKYLLDVRIAKSGCLARHLTNAVRWGCWAYRHELPLDTVIPRLRLIRQKERASTDGVLNRELVMGLDGAPARVERGAGQQDEQRGTHTDRQDAAGADDITHMQINDAPRRRRGDRLEC